MKKKQLFFSIFLLTTGWLFVPINCKAQIIAKDEKTGKYGLKNNQTGEWLVSPIFESFENFNPIQNVARVKYNGKYGFVTKNGKWCIEPFYTNAELCSDAHVIIVSCDTFLYAINFRGKIISDTTFRNLKIITPLMIYGQKLGEDFRILDGNFKPVIETAFKSLKPISGNKIGCYIFENDQNLYGVCNAIGEIIIPAQYKSIKQFGWMDYKYLRYDKLRKYQLGNLLLVQDNETGKCKLINFYNQVVVNTKTTNLYDFERKISGLNFFRRLYLLNYFSKNQDYLSSMVKDLVAEPYYKYKAAIDNDLLQLPDSFIELDVEIGVKVSPIYQTVKIKKKKEKKILKGYAFYECGIQKGEIYKSIEKKNGYYELTSEMGKKGIANEIGEITIPCSYYKIPFWNEDEGIIRIEKDEKIGLIDVFGKEILSPKYSFISALQGEFVFADLDGKYQIINKHGRIINHAYLYDTYDNINGSHYVSVDGYETELDQYGNEKVTIAAIIMDMVVNSSEILLRDKIEYCKKALNYNTKYDYSGIIYCQIGCYYEQLGEEDRAIEYYKNAKSYGNTTASNRLRQIYDARLQKAFDELNNSLGQLANAIAGAASGNTSYNSNYSSHTNNSNQSSSNNNRSDSNQNIKKDSGSSYNSLDYAYSNWESYIITNAEKLSDSDIRYATKKMKEIREQIKKLGYTKYKSPFEDYEYSINYRNQKLTK